MRFLWAAMLVLSLPLPSWAQQPHEEERQRALIELDRRGRENAGEPLPPQVGRVPLNPDPEVARQLRPYERMREAQKSEPHVLQLPPPAVQKPQAPLPLPGGPQPGVDPVTVPGGRD